MADVLTQPTGESRAGDDVDPFVQVAPRVRNRFAEDPALRRVVRHAVPAQRFEQLANELTAVSDRAANVMSPLATRAEANPPRHVPFDAWGARVDRIEVDPAWTGLIRIAQELGLVGLPYEERNAYGRIAQGALMQIVEPASASALCPLAMTDAAATALLAHDPLLDVGSSGTVARCLDGEWRLRGTKWFTSATTADIALALARPEGQDALALFLVELRRPNGTWNGLRVRRLKEKLGTHALPTAELDLLDTLAVPVGSLERGVAKAATMLNVARLWAAHGAVGETGHALALARDYARRRIAFGHTLAEAPVHVRWLARIAAEYEAMLALVFRASELVGAGNAPELTRVLTPLCKLACARGAVRACSELLESFGGAGYLEDTGIPRILRDVHVHCIWEGTTSVLSLDVVRALRASGVGAAFLDDVESHARSGADPALAGCRDRVTEALAELRVLIDRVDEQSARRTAWAMARVYQAALLIAIADGAIVKHGDYAGVNAAKAFVASPLLDYDEGLEPGALAALALGEFTSAG